MMTPLFLSYIEVHQETFPLYYGRPTASPAERMFREPIWCTWAEYKTDINQTKVLQLASDVIERGFPYSQVTLLKFINYSTIFEY